MKYTPHGIKNQEFNKAVRGYDREEVKAFLENLADEFERLQKENDKYEYQLESQTQEVKEFKRIEKHLQNTLLSAQENSSKAFDSVKKQTNLMLKEAELKSAQMIEKAKEEAEKVVKSVSKLREERKLIIARLSAFVDTQIDILRKNIEEEKMLGAPFKKIAEARKAGKPIQNIDVGDILEKLL